MQLLRGAEEERKEGEKNLKAQTAALKKHVEKTVAEADEELQASEAESRNFAKVEEAFAYLQNYSMKTRPVEEEAPMMQEECEEPFAEAALPVGTA